MAEAERFHQLVYETTLSQQPASLLVGLEYEDTGEGMTGNQDGVQEQCTGYQALNKSFP